MLTHDGSSNSVWEAFAACTFRSRHLSFSSNHCKSSRTLSPSLYETHNERCRRCIHCRHGHCMQEGCFDRIRSEMQQLRVSLYLDALSYMQKRACVRVRVRVCFAIRIHKPQSDWNGIGPCVHVCGNARARARETERTFRNKMSHTKSRIDGDETVAAASALT